MSIEESGRSSVADPELVARLRREVGDALVAQRRAFKLANTPLSGEDERELARSLIWQAIRSWAADQLTYQSAVVPQVAQEELARAVWAAMYQADRLQRLLNDPDVEHVNIIGCDKVFVRYSGGRKVRLDEPIAESDEALVELVRRMAGWVGLSSRPWDVSNPWLRLRLPGGERLTAIWWVCARPSIAIRRNRHPDMDLAKMVELGSATPLVAGFLHAAVRARLTMAIAGDQHSGKTTTARALIRAMDPNERILCAEESLELDIEGLATHDDVVEFEAREGYGSATGELGLVRLVRMMLTHDGERCIIGECTGPEVLALLNATLGGAGGSLTTIHAKHPKGVPNRIATFAGQAEERLSREAALMLVAEALELVVFQRAVRDRHTGQVRIVISDIVQIEHYNGTEVVQSHLFKWNPEAGQAEPQKGLLSSDSMARAKDAGFDPYLYGLGGGGWD